MRMDSIDFAGTGESPVLLLEQHHHHHDSCLGLSSSKEETTTAAAAAQSPGTAASSADSYESSSADEISSRSRPGDQAYRDRFKKTKMEIENNTTNLHIWKLEYENADLNCQNEILKQENASLAKNIEKLTSEAQESELAYRDLQIETEKLKFENAHLKRVNDLAHRLSQLERSVQCSNLKNCCHAMKTLRSVNEKT